VRACVRVFKCTDVCVSTKKSSVVLFHVAILHVTATLFCDLGRCASKDMSVDVCLQNT